MLSIDKAIELYELVGPFIPDKPPEDATQFVGTIVHNMIVANQHANYIKAIALMCSKTDDEIIAGGVGQAFELFVKGFVENDVLSIKNFLNKVGWL